MTKQPTVAGAGVDGIDPSAAGQTDGPVSRSVILQAAQREDILQWAQHP